MFHTCPCTKAVEFLVFCYFLIESKLAGLLLGGVFAQRTDSANAAPIIMLFIPGTPLKTSYIQKHA